MKKTIEMLKQNGFFQTTVDNVRRGMSKDVMEDVLTIILLADEDFEHQWVDDVHKLGIEALWKAVQEEVEEQEAVEALDDVDPEALFRKATGQDQEKQDFESKLQEAVEALKDEIRLMFDGLK